VVAVRSEQGEAARLRGALARISRSLDRQTPQEGLSPSAVWVLGTVNRLGPLGMGELAEFEGINPTMLSRIVAKLVDAGLVERIAHERDGRAVRVRITEQGGTLLTRLREERTRLFTARLAELPDEHAAQLLDALPALEALGLLMRRDIKPADES
jgi:DNA-binding MarR family transcriptional regulator